MVCDCSISWSSFVAFVLWCLIVAFPGHTHLHFGLLSVIVAFPGHTHLHFGLWSVVVAFPGHTYLVLVCGL